MAALINNIDDVYDAVQTLKNIKKLFSEAPGNNGNKDIIEMYSSLTDMLLSCGEYGIDELLETFETASYNQIDILNHNDIITANEFDFWYSIAKNIITLVYTYVSLTKKTDNISYDYERDKLLLDFFSDQEWYTIIAHYLTAERFRRSDPKMCYELIIEDFKKFPDITNTMYQNNSYKYDAESINEKITEACPICGEKEYEPFYCANLIVFNDNRFSPAKLWCKCSKCGNLYSYNFPVMETGNINGHYTKKNSENILKPNRQLQVYSEIFNNIKTLNDGNKYLEIGVGNGEMLAVALEMGYDASAVEICKEDCINISGSLDVDIKWCDFMEYKSEEKYDVIVMGDVLEHVTKPIKALEKAYEMLNENGILWLSTPNFNSAFTRMRKFADPMWNQKNHFTYFSYETLKPFLDKIGFEVKRYEVSARYNGSMELYLKK